MSKLYSSFALSRLFELDRQTVERAVRDLPPDGFEGRKRAPRWKLSRVAAVLADRRIANDDPDASSHSDTASLTAERARLVRAQADAAALKTAIMKRQVVSLAVAKRALESEYCIFRERSLSIRGKISAGCVGRTQAEVEQIIDDEVREMLEDLYRGMQQIVDGDRAEPSDDAVQANAVTNGSDGEDEDQIEATGDGT